MAAQQNKDKNNKPTIKNKQNIYVGIHISRKWEIDIYRSIYISPKSIHQSDDRRWNQNQQETSIYMCIYIYILAREFVKERSWAGKKPIIFKKQVKRRRTKKVGTAVVLEYDYDFFFWLVSDGWIDGLFLGINFFCASFCINNMYVYRSGSFSSLFFNQQQIVDR